jgi:hypothetical protein
MFSLWSEMDILYILLTLVSMFLVIGIPSYFLYKLFSSKFKLIECIAFVLIGESVLFSLTALFFRYHLYIMLIEVLICIIVMLLIPLFQKNKIKQRKIKHRKSLSFTIILILSIISLVFLSLPLVINVPFDVDGQGFGYMSLVVKQSGSITNLAPYNPEIEWVYSPAFPIFSAFISDTFDIPLHVVMPVFSAIMAILLLIYGYEFGKRVKNKMFGFLFAFCQVCGIWLFLAFFDSHYAGILATFFLIVFIDYFFRTYEKPTKKNIFISSFALTGIFYSHPDTIFNFLIGFCIFYLTVLFCRHKKKFDLKKYLTLFGIIPFLAVIFSLPYMIHVISILRKYSFEHVGFYTQLSNIKIMFIYGGVLVPILSVIGLYFAFKKRTAINILMITWFFAIIEFSSIGLFEYIFSYLPFNPLFLMYPFGIAWHAPIIPLPFLAAITLYNLFIYFEKKKFIFYIFIKKNINLFLIIILFLLIGSIFFANKIILCSKKLPLPLYGEFSSYDDVNAMLWIKENTPEDALIFNYARAHPEYPATSYSRFEGDWVPTITERKTVFFRNQPFFFNKEDSIEYQQSMFYAYYDPVNETSNLLIYKANIDYVIVPQMFENPNEFSKMYRWRYYKTFEQLSSFDDADYLKLVYDSNGAKVYKVI